MRMEEAADIYLIACSDATYYTYVAETPAETPDFPEAAFLVKEGQYPAELFYHRYDIMGDIIVGRDICEDRDDLISCLNWHGICLHRIISLWDMEKQPSNEKLVVLFANAYAKHCEYQ